MNIQTIKFHNNKEKDLLLIVEPFWDEIILPKNSFVKIIVSKINNEFDDGLSFFISDDNVILHEARDLQINIYADELLVYPPSSA